MELKIEKGVPLPPSRVTVIAAALRQLEIGDSIFLSHTKNTRAVSGRCSMMQRKTPGLKFTSRSVEGGVRIWRLA